MMRIICAVICLSTVAASSVESQQFDADSYYEKIYKTMVEKNAAWKLPGLLYPISTFKHMDLQTRSEHARRLARRFVVAGACIGAAPGTMIIMPLSFGAMFTLTAHIYGASFEVDIPLALVALTLKTKGSVITIPFWFEEVLTCWCTPIGSAVGAVVGASSTYYVSEKMIQSFEKIYRDRKGDMTGVSVVDFVTVMLAI